MAFQSCISRHVFQLCVFSQELVLQEFHNHIALVALHWCHFAKISASYQRTATSQVKQEQMPDFPLFLFFSFFQRLSTS